MIHVRDVKILSANTDSFGTKYIEIQLFGTDVMGTIVQPIVKELYFDEGNWIDTTELINNLKQYGPYYY